MRSTFSMMGLSAALLLTLASAAFARATALPPELQGRFRSSQSCGEASLRVFVFYAYDAALWFDTPAMDYSGPVGLALTYRMDFSREELIDSTVKEIRRQDTNLSAAREEKLRAQLASIYVDVHADDRFTALYQTGKGVTLYFNGTKRGHLPAEFSRAFMDIWLSPNSSEPQMRAQLLQCRS